VTFLATPRSFAAAAIVSVVLVSYVLLPGTGPWARNVAVGAWRVYQHRNASPDARATVLLGDDYLLIARAARSTPADSRILIPSGAEHGPLANKVWCLYYLYPRRVLQERDLHGLAALGADYVLVHHGWGLELAGVSPMLITGREAGIFDLRTGRSVGTPQ